MPHRLLLLLFTLLAPLATHAELLAGTAKMDITNYDAGPVNDPLYVKALVLKNSTECLAIITVDAVAIGEIGHIGNDYLPAIRREIEAATGIAPNRLLVNASHCHGVVVPDVAARTVAAVVEAAGQLESVRTGAGAGSEHRISENRRFTLKSGRTVDSRHAYALPPDEEIAAIGSIDPEIGVLRLDRTDGNPLAVLYNFACHPIQGVPSKGNTADMTGFASRVIEENAGEGVTALFLQGCAGDINPIGYKAVDHPRDAEPLGNLLGLAVLRTFREIETSETNRFQVLHEILPLPRANVAERIAEMEQEREALLASLQGTSLNFKTFLPLAVKYSLSPEFPSYYAHQYLHEEAQGREDLKKLDEENRANLDKYISNIQTMEGLTRLQTNLALLKKHQGSNESHGMKPVEAELLAVRIGDFVLTTFPGELTVEIGLNIKRASPHPNTFVAGYTNGYLYYAPTHNQRCNAGGAQEDSDSLLAPEWQAVYEQKVAELLERL